MSDSAGENLVLVGEITAPFGVRGEVKMVPLIEDPRALRKLPGIRLRWPDGREETRKIKTLRLHQEAALVLFEDWEDRNAAELLRGVEVYIRQEELPPLPPGEFYHHQLMGLRVCTDTGRELGTIEKIYYNPANDVYETSLALIPAVETEFILSVDLDAGVMLVRDVPGLEK